MSYFPTRLQVKQAVENEIPIQMDVDHAIQEVVDRAYEAGVAIGSRTEITIDLSTEKTEWDGYNVILVDPEIYDGIASVRDNEKPRSIQSWEVRDVEAEHQSPGATQDDFTDHGLQDIEGEKRRVYQLPYVLMDKDDVIRPLMKKRSPRIDLDTDEIPLKNLYVAKLGMLAVGYENEADARAEGTWNRFLLEASSNQKRSDGPKKRYLGMDTGVRRKPTNFM